MLKKSTIFRTRQVLNLSTKKLDYIEILNKMVAPTGIEPVTQGFSVFFTKRLSIEMRLDLSKIAFISAYFHP